jgi:SAM-dependent methyltransferase
MSANRDLGIKIPNEAWPYLQMQRGAISDMRADHHERWLQAYTDAVYGEFDCIEPYLPATCGAVLDVGSGLGGINILLTRHFGDQCEVSLLDGATDAPMVKSHDETFNHFDVARNFLSLNGVRHIHCIDASKPLVAPSFYDLVVSFKSWCFHIEPSRYIDFVHRHCAPGARIIVDMRHRDRAPMRSYEWMRQMTGTFRHVAVLHYGVKFETHLFDLP